MDEIIVGVDASSTAASAARTASELASRCDRTLHVVMAIPKHTSSEVKSGTDTWHVDSVAEAEQSLASIVSGLGANGPVTKAVVVDDPAKALCAEAERLDAAMIVVGNRRVRGIARVLGAVATDVTRNAPCDVLIANTLGD